MEMVFMIVLVILVFGVADNIFDTIKDCSKNKYQSRNNCQNCVNCVNYKKRQDCNDTVNTIKEEVIINEES